MYYCGLCRAHFAHPPGPNFCAICARIKLSADSLRSPLGGLAVRLNALYQVSASEAIVDLRSATFIHDSSGTSHRSHLDSLRSLLKHRGPPPRHAYVVLAVEVWYNLSGCSNRTFGT